MDTAFVRVILIGCGGFIGAVLRYGLGGLVQSRFGLSTFPYGTLTVNLVGCLLMGTFAGLVDARQLFSPEFRMFALLGLLGGFTTYSTFGYEAFAMLRDGESARAALYVGLHVAVGLTLVWAGYVFTASKWSGP